MMSSSVLLTALALCVSHTAAGPLDDYVSAPEPSYGWHDTGARVKLPFGGVAHILNVTSQQWLTVEQAVGPNGAQWTHQVAVIVPKT